MIRLTAVIELEGQAPRALTHESNARVIIIGRDASADFQLPIPTISRQHARISEQDQVYFVEDLGSTHGTVVNGKPVDSSQKKLLRNGDVIELTKAKITCNIETSSVAFGEGEGTQAIAVKAVEGILGRLGESQSEGPFLRVLSGADEGARLRLSGPRQEWTLGRSKDCEHTLNDANVSRRHALVKRDWNGFLIQDLGSRNGVKVNEKLIEKPRRLHDRDEIILGPVKLLFVDPDAELLDALKDVPGFAPEEPVESEDEPEGAEENPGESADEAEKQEEQDDPGDSAEPASGETADEEEELPEIDPELLQESSRSPVEMIILAAVAVFALAAIGVLIFFLLF